MNIAVVALLLFHLWSGAERRGYEARVAALRAAGQPVRYEDLETPRVPDEENAAVVFAEAARILKKLEESEHPSLYGIHHATPEEREQMRVYLESLKPYFDLLAQIPKRPRWHVDHEWRKGPECKLDELMWIWEAASHLIWRAELDNEQKGRTRRAADAAVLVIDLGERWRLPMVLGDLVSQTATAYTAQLVRAASRQPGFDAAEFRRIVDPRLARALAATGPSREALAQERVIVFWAIETLRSGRRDMDGYLPLNGILHRSGAWRPLLYRDADRALDVFEEAIALANTSPEEALRVAPRLKAKCPRKDPRYPITELTACVLPRFFEAYARSAAAQRLTRVVMALLEYRQRERDWPETLAALGDLPDDPFSGKPFVYERTESGARIRAAKPGDWEALEEDDLAWTFSE